MYSYIGSYGVIVYTHCHATPSLSGITSCVLRMLTENDCDNQTRTLPMYIILYNVTRCIQPSVNHHTYTLISTYTHLPSLYNCFLSACSTFVPSLVTTFILFTKCLFHHAL